MKKYVSALLSIILILNIILLTGCGRKKFTIYDSAGEVLLSAHTTNVAQMKLEDKGMYSYIEQVMSETIGLVSDVEKCTLEEAKDLIVTNEYQIHTSFDTKVYESIKKSYQAQKEAELEFGCAVTDTKGHLLASYDGGNSETPIAASRKTQAYSSFKPLSVYAPALEAGIISWSKTYVDSPIKQVKEFDGTMRDWPANATDTYLNEPVTVVHAIKKSLNTVAVKCLQEYGVEASIQYLTENFGINLASEETKMHLQGEEEILGNIALGYLDIGVSPIDMAGYYQAFTNLGTYIAPKTVTKICDKEGTVLKETVLQEKRVMNVETAYVMNLLLQEVVSHGGTAEKAMSKDYVVGGKTGTGDNGNWFVGFTPQYTCAVWHGNRIAGNKTTEMFHEIVSSFEHDKKAEFPKCGTVDMKAYCMESGMFFSVSSGCKRADKGYYTTLDETKKCDVHK